MNTVRKRNLWFVLLLIGSLASCVCASAAAKAKEVFIPVLQTKSGAYTNVTVTAKSRTDVCIVHDGGVGNVAYTDLLPETLDMLGYVPPVPAKEQYKMLATGATSAVRSWLGELESDEQAGVAAKSLGMLRQNSALAAIMFGLLVHLLVSTSILLICRRWGARTTILVWIPGVQFIPIFRAVGMSAWWSPTMLIPVVNLFTFALWGMKAVKFLGKKSHWAVLLALPFVNLAAFAWLAFSAGSPPPIVPAATSRGSTTFMLPGMIRS